MTTSNQNNDGYVSLIQGLGTERDFTKQVQFQPSPPLTQVQLDAMFVDSGLTRTVVELPADEMVVPWMDVVADDKGEEVLDAMEVWGAKQVFKEAATWSRLHGGAVVVFVFEDGGDFATPLRQFKRIQGAKVFDRWDVTWDRQRLSEDPLKALAGHGQYITVNPHNAQGQILVHESRFVLIPGMSAPSRWTDANDGWGVSVLQGVVDSITRYSSSMDMAANILKDFIQAVLSVKGLSELFAAGRDDVVKRRIQLLDMSRSILNTLVIDADGEMFEKSASSVAGVADLLDRFAEHLSGVTRIPASKLYGKTPGSLGSTGKTDLRNYHEFLGSERDRILGALAEYTVKHTFLSSDGPTNGNEPEQWSFVWNPFEEPDTEKEAQIRKTVAETDKIYLELGVLAPLEVVKSRWGQGEWSMETQVEDIDARDSFKEAEEKAEEALAAMAEQGNEEPGEEEPNGPEV